MNIPNTLTIARIFLVPFVIYAIAQGDFLWAFWGFVIAGVTDAIDGFIARHFNMRTELGAYLDPLADKLLIMSIYISLAITHHIPFWLTLLVISRDILIIGGVLVSWLIDNPLDMRPHMVSKVNTTLQIAFAALILATLSFTLPMVGLIKVMIYLVAFTTIASTLVYLAQWTKHMAD